MIEAYQLEEEVLRRLREQPYHPPGIPLVADAVDQLRFFREAWELVRAECSSDREALQQIERLALPEALRRAKTTRQKKRLIQALESGNALWPWLPYYRRPEEWDRCQSSRDEMSAIVLGPYPSQTRPRGKHWTGLVAWFTPPPYPALPASLLVPVRCDGGETWYLELIVDGVVPIIVDAPRSPLSGGDLRSRLLVLAGLIEQGIGSFSLGWQGDPQTRFAYAQALHEAAAMRLSPSEHGRLLAEVFLVPGFTYSTPVGFLTLDMTAEQMACLIGEALSQRGWLARRELRQLPRYEEFCVLNWTRGEDTATAGQLVVRRLQHFRRPSRREALELFIRKTARRPVPVGLHRVREVNLRGRPEGRHVRQEAETSVPEPDALLPASRPELHYQPIARGQRKAIRCRYGLNARNFSRRFSRYCRERGLPESREALRAFEMILRRAAQQTFGPSR